MAAPLVGIELRAETARFQADMQRAGKSVEGVVGRMRTSFSSLKGALAGIGVGLSFAGLAVLAKDAAMAAEALGDLADVTGSSVEDLSKLSNQAKVAGGSFDEFEGALLKFTAKVGNAENVSAEFAQALKTLGVTAKDPAQALQQTIAGFDKFANGATKAAYAQEIFGKSGPRFLATLSDMARLQEVGATVTTKQAEETEKLAQEMRKLSVEASRFGNTLLSEIAPALTAAIELMREGTRIAGGFWAALLNFGTTNPFASVQDNLRATQQRIADMTAGSGSAEARWAKVLGVSGPLLDQLKKREEFLKFQQRQQALAGAAALGFTLDARDLRLQGAGGKPTLPGLPKGGGAGAGKDKISEAQRYLDNLQQQLDRTKDLSTEESVLLDIQRGRLKLSGDVTKAQLVQVARLIDAQKELDKEIEASNKLREDEAKARERASDIGQRLVRAAQDEALALNQQNEALRQETELIGKDLFSIERIIQARLDDAIAARKQEAAMLANAGASQAEIDAINDQVRALERRKVFLSERGVAERLAEDAQRAKEYNDIFVNSFTDGLSSIVEGTLSVSDGFKMMERQIVSSLTRIASQKIAESIFGAGSSSGGGGIFAGIGSMLSGLFGSTVGTPAGFAMGGSPPVGRPSLVGERGPELFVPKQSGVIIPNDVLMARRASSQTVNISVNVDGATTRATADQVAVRTGTAVRRALARNA